MIYFPENQLGASLKGAIFADTGHEHPDFPENQLGASLKATKVTTVPTANRVALPREPTRGLIEGSGMHALLVSIIPHFPENQLGASLKDGLTLRALPAPVKHFPENQLGASLKGPSAQADHAARMTSPRTNSGPH